MFTHTPSSAPKSYAHASRTRQQANDFSDLYFSFSSNLSPQTMKGRFPDSLFCGLAKLKDYKFTINQTGYANIEPSIGDLVFGALYFISKREEADLDEDGGVPDLYQKQWLEVVRVGADGAESEQTVPALVYVDSERRDRGEIRSEYVVWIRKAIRDAKAHGLPDEYGSKYVLPWLPASTDDYGEDVGRDMEPVRFIFSQNQFK